METIFTKHGKKNDDAENLKISLGFLQTICSGVGDMVGLLSTVFVMSAAAYFAIKGRFSAAKPVVERFKGILAEENGDDSDAGSTCKTVLTDRIAVKDVSFSYGDNNVLDKISVCFEKGRKYAVTGMSGSGKSTLINIVTGLLAADSGEVTYVLTTTQGIDLHRIAPFCKKCSL